MRDEVAGIHVPAAPCRLYAVEGQGERRVADHVVVQPWKPAAAAG